MFSFNWLRNLRQSIVNAIVGGFDDAVAVLEKRADDFGRQITQHAAEASQEVVIDAEWSPVTAACVEQPKALPAPAAKTRKVAKGTRKSRRS